MIARIIEFSVRNKWLVILVWLGVAIWGLYAVLHTPVDAIPDLSENQVIVFADWMGRSPQDIEDQVTYPLSVQLQGLAGVKAVRASSEFNFSMINVIFDEKTDFYFARQRVLERLTTAQSSMPQGVVPYMAPDATALGQIFWYTVEGEGKSLDELRAIQDFNVRYQLASVPGVAEVASVGGMVREYQVDIDPARLRSFDLSLGEVYSAIASSNMSVGGKIVVENSSEYLVRGIGWLQGVKDLENVVVTSRAGVPVRLRDLAIVQLGPEFRRSALEKNGREQTGGVVMMRYGQNPLSVTEAIKQKIRELQAGLPAGVRIVPFYDRTNLIESAIHTVTGTLKEEMIIASIAILLILTHFRSALVVCMTLPMAVLISFLFMFYLGIPSNIMSLCGIAISIGILVDAAVVMVENASHELKAHFDAHGGGKVQGDTTEIVVKACRLVGRPIFFSVIIMLLSFLPVFSFGGQEGKLSHPLAYTKSFAMIGVAVLAITFVPALIPLLIKGRIKGEEDNPIVRSFIHIYKPTLTWVIDRPAVVWWLMAIILAIGAALFGASWMSAGALFLGLVFTILGTGKTGWTMWILAGLVILAALMAVNRHDVLVTLPATVAPYTRWAILGIVVALLLLSMILKHWRTAAVGSLLVVTFLAHSHLPRLGSEFMPSLNEGSILDMPTSAPRIAMGQAIDDVMVRDRVLAGFPEVSMVVGKVGRADTATDPSPLDMVESIITLQPPELWPKRKVEFADLLRQSGQIASVLQRAGYLKSDSLRPEEWPDVVRAVQEPDFLKHNPRFTQASEVLNTAASVAIEKFDATMRDLARRRQREYEPELARQIDKLVLEELLTHVRSLAPRDGKKALLREPSEIEVSALLTKVQPRGLLLVEVARQEEVDHLLADLRDELVQAGVLAGRDDLLLDADSVLRDAAKFVRRAIGSEPLDFSQRVLSLVQERHESLAKARLKTLDWELFDHAPGLINEFLSDRIVAAGKDTPLQGNTPDAAALQRLRDEQTPALAAKLFLWRKTKEDLLQEIDSELQMPGWGNAWTQPIINRVNMLATGVRTQIGVKVFGPTGKPLVRFEPDPTTGQLVDRGAIADVQRVSEQIAARLKTINGAVDVIPDQAVGKRYLEITIDREKAARYGVNMTELSQAVETALGGGRITTTIEGRQRFPVRLRYTRESWQSLDDVKNVLVSAQMTPAQLLDPGAPAARPMPAPAGMTPRTSSPAANSPAMGGGGMGGGAAPGMSADKPAAGPANSSGGSEFAMPTPGAGSVQIPLSMVADIRVVQGPSMIKSENGRLRVGSSRVDLQACKLEYSIVSPK